jgi:hypothetical protein
VGGIDLLNTAILEEFKNHWRVPGGFIYMDVEYQERFVDDFCEYLVFVKDQAIAVKAKR